jgi:tRNA threonylcarbamoyladenosine biosynthesis protein TsaE
LRCGRTKTFSSLRHSIDESLHIILHNSNDNGSAAFTETELTCYLADESATLALGSNVSALLQPGLIILLEGNLGTGKTTLARGILRGLGYPGKVKSPTYNLVEPYKFSRLYFYHFDFYRFNNPIEWEEAGFREYFNPGSVCLVEWPRKAGRLLPAADLIFFLSISDGGREVKIHAATEEGKQCLKELRNLRNF